MSSPPSPLQQPTIRTIIIDRDPMARQVIHQALGEFQEFKILAETENLIYGYELVRQNRPQLVFVELQEENPQKSIEVINRISTYFKNTLIYVSGRQLTLETILTCMQAGAREYIPRPLEIATITQAVIKHQKALTADEQLGDTSGRIITVFSNKGGLGKTTIAVNLALSLSELLEQPVALVDLNLQLGDITTFLNINPQQTIVDIAKNIDRVDASYLENSLAHYQEGKANVYILADPLYVEDAEEISSEQINTVLTILKATFPYVIIDTNTSFDSKTLTALDLADNVLLISCVNLPTIRSTQRVLSLFSRLGYDPEKVKLVLNRYVDDDEITLEDIEETLNKPVYFKLPNSYQVVMTSINRGIPVGRLESGNGLHQQFLNFARKISGLVDTAPLRKNITALPSPEASKKLFGGLFGKR